jgi:ketosteroid isomerase-like protein
MSSQPNEIEVTIRRYYEGCNAADRDAMLACLAPDAVHYFPAGARQGTFVGASAIADGWIDAVGRLDSRWTIDSLLIDPVRGVAAVEWTHFKPGPGVHLRGAELFEFAADGRIAEIRAYYAAAAVDPGRDHDLGDFDYAGRGFALDPPAVTRVQPITGATR